MWQTVGVIPIASKGLETADAQEDFLANPQFAIAAIEAAGDHAIDGRIRGDVGIQQIELDPTDGDAPDLGLHRATGVLNADRQRPAASLRTSSTGILNAIVLDVGFLLPAVDVQILAEIPLLVHQSRRQRCGMPKSEALLRWSPSEDAQAT